MNRAERRRLEKSAAATTQKQPALLLQQATDAHRAGRLDEAERLYRRVKELSPATPGIDHWHGLLLKDKGLLPEAIVALERAIRLAPEDIGARLNLGALYYDTEQHEEARHAFETVTRARPEIALAWRNLGMALIALQQPEKAAEVLRRGLRADANDSLLHFELGNALLAMADHEGAAVAYRRAIALNAGYVDAYCNLSSALLYAHRLDAAEAALGQALRLAPAHANAQFGLALLHLLRGDFAAGWALFDSRLGRKNVLHAACRDLGPPSWDGSPLNGRTLLIYDEQGLGDAIQFVRYVPLAARAGGRVILAVRPALMRLFAGIEGVAVTSLDQPLPAYDLHCPLLTLPRFYGPRHGAVPVAGPYLRAEPDLAAQWHPRIGNSGFRFGIFWSGNPKFPRDRERSLTFDAIAPLFQLDTVRWFNCQKETRPEDQARLEGLAGTVTTIGHAFADFADTAAAFSALDLLISVDTSVIHLAGALGTPAWLMLPAVPDWRWQLDREDSPWYPSLRLFRQATPGDWGGVVSRIRSALAHDR